MKRILIVDDELGFIFLLKMNLERTGRYLVREEPDATRTLKVAEEFRPDVVLLDMIMPKLDGRDVACQIRSSPLLRDTPIVFLTATALKEVSDQQVDGCSVVAKPASAKDVIDAIENTLLSHVNAPAFASS